MKIIVTILFYVSMAYYFYVRDKHFNRKILVFMLLKVLAMLAFVYLYTHVYQGDLYQLKILVNQWDTLRFHEIFSANDSRFELEIQSKFTLFFQRFFAITYFIGFKNLYLTAFVLLVMSWVIILETYLILQQEDESLSDTYLLAMCVPSILFWTSSVCKELLVLPMFCYVLVCVRAFYFSRKISVFHSVVFLISIWFLLGSRFFHLPFVGIIVWTFFAIKFARKLLFWSFTVVFILIYVLGQKFVLPHLQPDILLGLIYDNYYQMHDLSGIGSRMEIDFQEKTWLGVLWAYLQALQGVFFVAFGNAFSSIVSVENLVLVVLLVFIFTFVKWRKLPTEIWAMVFFVLLVSGFIALVSPNYGSMSRYRVIYWFFVWWFVVYQIKSLPIIRRLLG